MKTSVQKMVFFSNILADGYNIRVRVTGTSMSPFLEAGSYVTLSKVPLSELRIGDIIFCRCDDGSFKLHRLIGIKNQLLITKGDALCLPDQPFEKDAYQGKVIRTENRQSDTVISRNMESWSVQAVNYLIALYFRFKLYLINQYVGFMSKTA